MSEGIGVDVTATPNLISANPSSRDKVIHVLATALQVRHGVRDGHQRG